LNSGAIRQRSFFFKPIVVLFFSFAGASLYALYMLRSAGFKPSVFNFSGSFFYVVPIIVPFVAFLFDTVQNIWRNRESSNILLISW
jgi:hypothetical protein